MRRRISGEEYLLRGLAPAHFLLPFVSITVSRTGYFMSILFRISKAL